MAQRDRDARPLGQRCSRKAIDSSFQEYRPSRSVKEPYELPRYVRLEKIRLKHVFRNHTHLSFYIQLRLHL